MKYLFLAAAVLLSVAAVAIHQSFPGSDPHHKVLYWVTDRNPARVEQIAGFPDWLVAQGLVDDQGRPVYELKLDTINNDDSKQVIQGVSGVGSDLIDMGPLRYFQSIGLLCDITDPARERGFDPSHTWPAIEPDITVDGRQYAVPASVNVPLMWVNLDTFHKYGIDPPPMRWTFEDFERIGKQFIAAANPPGERQAVFFAMDIDLRTMHRSLGLSRFNETLTHSALLDPRFVQALELKRKWVMDDRILPTRTDQAAFATQAGFGGAKMQLFYRGNYAMLELGRYLLVQLRRFGTLQLAVVEPPNGGMPNVLLNTRCVGVYTASPEPELALHFLAYLNSDAYNRQIIADADSLPPDPAYTESEAYLHPPDHPNEWGVHGPFADAARTIGITASSGPFILDSVVDRLLIAAEGSCMSGRLTPEQAARQAHERIEAEISRTLEEHPELAAQYEQCLADQATIDRLRSEGKRVPVSLIRNPFHVYYYRAQGWLEE